MNGYANKNNKTPAVRNSSSVCRSHFLYCGRSAASFKTANPSDKSQDSEDTADDPPRIGNSLIQKAVMLDAFGSQRNQIFFDRFL